LFTVFILLPLLSLAAKPFYTPIIYAGILLAFCSPSAIVTAFWAKIFNADPPTGIVMSITTNLLSIATIPFTMWLAIGTLVDVDLSLMTLNLTELILIPLALSFTLKKLVKTNWNRLNKYGSNINLIILIFLIWGSVAPSADYARNNLTEFASLNTFIFALLAVAFAASYLLSRRYGHKKATTIAIGTMVKNAALSLVIGLNFFGQPILPPLIANLIAQNVLLVPLKAILKDR
jgi:predicted Na+-dependent transporter